MKKALILIFSILIFCSILLHIFPTEEIYAKPLRAKDSDGTQSEEILENMRKGYETIILKHFPYGFLEVEEWEKVKFPKKAYAIIKWRTYEELGAGNIYIGYSFDGKNYKEIGPFNESVNFTTTIIEIPVNPLSDLSKLKVRFRGEDTDFGVDAISEVRIELKIIKYKLS